MTDPNKRIEELIEIAKAATAGPYHIGHIDEYIPNLMDVENHEGVIVAEDIDGKNGRYLCAFNPDFVLKLLESWKELYMALEIVALRKGFRLDDIRIGDPSLEWSQQATAENALAKAEKVFE